MAHKNKNKNSKVSLSGANEQRKKKQKAPISGFSTLSQVSGVPKAREYHSKLSVPPVKTVQQPEHICPMCNEKIEIITDAFLNENGEYVHFECVLNDLKSKETLLDNQTLSYIGSGNFAVCQKGEDGKWCIIKTINYESAEKNKAFKEYVEGLKL